MKVRQGFVSNSSSTSFVIKEESIKTTAECALQMLKIVKDDYFDEDRESIIEGIRKYSNGKILMAIKWLQNNIKYDGNIYFPWSINYKTYIWKNNNGIFVDTCNNHYWHNHFAVDSRMDHYCWYTSKYNDTPEKLPSDTPDPIDNYFDEYLDLSDLTFVDIKDNKYCF